LLVVCSFAKELKTTDAIYKKLLFAIRPNLPEQFLARVNQMFEWISGSLTADKKNSLIALANACPNLRYFDLQLEEIPASQLL
jgi:hypothetical protein